MSAPANHPVTAATVSPQAWITLGTDAGSDQAAPGRLRWRARSCLNTQDRNRSCDVCANACTLEALSLRDGQPRLIPNTACSGCGACAAACPSGALQATGFGWPARLPEVPTLRIDCWQVEDDRRSAWRVPCLAGLTPDALVFLRALHPERPIQLRDAGLCAGCPVHRQDGFAGQGAAARGNALLMDAGVPPRLQLSVTREPARRCTPRDAALERLGTRRNFLATLAGQVAALNLEPETTSPAPMARVAREAGPAALRRAALRVLAAKHRTPLPATLFHVASVSAHCVDHGVCAAVCPTGALRRPDTGQGLDFEADACIGCGLCARACPEGSLSVTTASVVPPRGATTLVRHALHTCPGCGREHAGADGLCPACDRRQGLARAGFEQLFGGARA